jgi:hypothetical protein
VSDVMLPLEVVEALDGQAPPGTPHGDEILDSREVRDPARGRRD